MRWHILEGEAGCAYAVEHDCVAVVVDALRASATAAMLLEAGAAEILVVREVETALDARHAWHEALLYGERNNVAPPGFDYGNSPFDAVHAKDRRVIFTTTNGARRMDACWGARAAYLGTTVNAAATVKAAAAHGTDVVLIPAGQYGVMDHNSQEDWAAAVWLAQCAHGVIGEGKPQFNYWKQRIEQEGLEAIFQSAPHARNLRHLGLDADIAFCARVDVTAAVPGVAGRSPYGTIMRNAG